MKNKKQKRNKPELLAPAGNLEKMKTAFAFGADAVYAGIPDFSLRVRVNDFNIKSLGEAIQYAHKIGKKVYVTVNIFAHNEHLAKLPKHVKELKKINPDGIFVSDPGVAAMIKKEWPRAKFILSTQANCTNWRSAKFWQNQGFKRVILSREVSLLEAKEIRKKIPNLEIETFVHGALCMAYSGRCFISRHMTGRDANLGDCAQPCRWKYKTTINKQQLTSDNIESILIQPDNHEALELIEEKHGSYILNSRDLCLIKRVPDLINAGVSAFKIEGRAKSVYYLGCVVGAYRQAIDICFDKKVNKKNKIRILKKLYNELDEKLYHRGYTEGFMFGQGEGAQNLDNSHKVPDWEFCGQVIEVKSERLKSKKSQKNEQKYLVKIKVHNTLKVDDQIEIIGPAYDIIKMKLRNIVDAKTGEKIKEAHGGQKTEVFVETSRPVAEYSVLRRKIK